MAVPDYQSFMLPLLLLTADDEDHTLPEVKEQLADELGLTDEERIELLPSGRKTRLQDRVGWAKTYLQAAGLLDSPARAIFRITREGHRLLAAEPTKIDLDVLSRFESFRRFRERAQSGDGTSADPGAVLHGEPEAPASTPADALEAAYRQHRAGLTQELLAQVRTMSPTSFERTVVELMIRLGYGGAEGRGTHLGRSGDGGVDGVISADKLGLELVYLQAKRWEAAVGRPAVQAFVGSLEGLHARKGVLMATSQFTPEALAYNASIEKRVALVDGLAMAGLMVDTGLGVTAEATYVVSGVDSEFFSDEG